MERTDELIEGMHDRPGYLVRRLQQIAVATFLQRVEGTPVTPIRYGVLFALHQRPGIDQTTLSALTALDRTTLGTVIRELLKRKLIRQLPDPNDLRRAVWALTPAGRALLARVEAPVRASQDDLLAPLGEAERRRLLQLIHKVVAAHNGLGRPPTRTRASAGKPRKRTG